MRLNFSYGIIAIVGILVAVSIGFIITSPDEIPEPRVIVESQLISESLPVLTVTPSLLISDDPIVGDSFYFEIQFKDNDDNIVDHVNYDIIALQNSENILSDLNFHRHPGKHPIHETSILNESDVQISITLQGLGHGDDITKPKGIETLLTISPKPLPVIDEAAAQTLPTTLTVSLPVGSGVPGCEVTNECFLPYEETVAIGATVTWSNDDTAAHTVTSGSPADGPDGLFDSSIFMAGSTFEFTFNDAGSYDYFCMVHPWMLGMVNVD